VQVFLAGGVPELMLHLRDLGLLKLDALTVTGQSLGEISRGGKNPSAAPVSAKNSASSTASIPTASFSRRPPPAPSA
jgi:dihydroxyacid dehydratase/phosphogluconate dehydratase